MSFNYRKARAARISKSRRRIIFLLFEEDFQFFPTLKEIMNELIAAQMH